MDTSIAQVKKLLSGDYLTFYTGNLFYRANDLTLNIEDGHRKSISDLGGSNRIFPGRKISSLRLRYGEMKGVTQFAFAFKLAESSHSITGKPLFGRPKSSKAAINHVEASLDSGGDRLQHMLPWYSGFH